MLMQQVLAPGARSHTVPALLPNALVSPSIGRLSCRRPPAIGNCVTAQDLFGVLPPSRLLRQVGLGQGQAVRPSASGLHSHKTGHTPVGKASI
jgi:hypothetical protein